MTERGKPAQVWAVSEPKDGCYGLVALVLRAYTRAYTRCHYVLVLVPDLNGIYGAGSCITVPVRDDRGWERIA